MNCSARLGAPAEAKLLMSCKDGAALRLGAGRARVLAAGGGVFLWVDLCGCLLAAQTGKAISGKVIAKTSKPSLEPVCIGSGACRKKRVLEAPVIVSA